ncbi:hypothetical protein PG988_012758 [Apiospora saccharicola]
MTSAVGKPEEVRGDLGSPRFDLRTIVYPSAALGRQQATYDLRYLSTSLRHYACADCCRKIEDDKTGEYLSGTGWHVFEVQGLPDAFNPTVKPMPPSTTTTSGFSGPPQTSAVPTNENVL